MQPVYPDLNMTTDDSSIVELGFVVEANFLTCIKVRKSTGQTYEQTDGRETETLRFPLYSDYGSL